MVYFRTDANEQIATGHMMRCMTVAKELAIINQEVKFLVSDEASVDLLIENGFKYKILDTNWRYLDNREEIKKTKIILEESYEKDHKIPLLFVDSYFVSNHYFEEIKSFAKLAIFDDLCQDVYDVDFLINYNITCNMYDYKTKYAGKHTQLLLGLRYIPLRKQFSENINKKRIAGSKAYDYLENKMTGKYIQVLLVCGGGDPLNILVQILNKVSEEREFESYYFHVVIGAYNPNAKEIESFSKSFSNIRLYYDIKNMAELMETCDIAISAASTVLYECCAMGLPTIFFVMADNQEENALALAESSCMLYAGDIRKKGKETIESILKYLCKLSRDRCLRSYMSQQMQEIVDGGGAKRIVNKVGVFLK